ncbi:hypothetical protein Y032_0171g305 [Ancylostoma ceylanicum]|uniref:Uncharacterized protein n=1 Tax=Ancylostoma ceylanicum TaxID=53326 RepID=A0A016SVU7_9BILA|nr:hypothetical protein Y032_0171g305 [Ancylostoma ceylanicum]
MEDKHSTIVALYHSEEKQLQIFKEQKRNVTEVAERVLYEKQPSSSVKKTRKKHRDFEKYCHEDYERRPRTQAVQTAESSGIIAGSDGKLIRVATHAGRQR